MIFCWSIIGKLIIDMTALSLPGICSLIIGIEFYMSGDLTNSSSLAYINIEKFRIR